MDTGEPLSFNVPYKTCCWNSSYPDMRLSRFVTCVGLAGGEHNLPRVPSICGLVLQQHDFRCDSRSVSASVSALADICFQHVLTPEQAPHHDVPIIQQYIVWDALGLLMLAA